MSINEAPGYQSNLTKEQQRQAEAAIYGVPQQPPMTPTNPQNITAEQAEFLRHMLQQYDSQHSHVNSFDLNNPPRAMTLAPGAPAEPYPYQNPPQYPRMIYDPAKRTTLIVQNREQLDLWLARGYSTEPYPSEPPEESELDPESAAEAAAVDAALKKKRIK